MRYVIPFALTVCLGLWACGGSPSMPPLPPCAIASSSAGASTPCPTLAFDGFDDEACAVTTYTKCGFTVTATTPNWTVFTRYGHPAPAIVFESAAGATTTGEVRVTAAAGTFTFQSVDVYSSTTPIPYVITGFANSAPVFTVQGTQGNTFGAFATISNPNAGAQIDALVIRLVNPAAPCCSNPTGLDNIVVM